MIMKKLSTKTGGGLMQVLVVSYIATFMLSLVAGTVIINIANKRSINDTYNYNVVLINQVKESIDQIVSDVELYAKSMQTSPELIEIMQYDGLTVRSYDILMPLIADINSFCAGRDYVKDAYIYCADSDLIVGDTIYETRQAYSDKFTKCANSFGQWQQDYLQTNHYLEFVPESRSNGIDYLSGLNLVNTLYKNKNSSERIGAIIIRLDTNKIVNDIFMNGFSLDSSFYILNKVKSPLISYQLNQKDIDIIPYIDFEGKGRIETDDDRLITFNNSGRNNWIYAAVTPKSVIFKNVYIMRVYFAIIIFLYFIAGITIGLFGLHRSYGNIGKIADAIGLRKNIGSVGADDIVNQINTINLKRKDLERRVNIYSDEKRNTEIMRFISGMDGEERGVLSDTIKLPEQSIRVMTVRISDCGIFDTNDEKDRDKPVLCVVNMLDELLDNLCVHYIANRDRNFICCLLNYSMDNDEFKHRLTHDICGIINKVLQEQFEISIETGISNAITDKSGIADLYSETLMVLDYRSTRQTGTVHYFEDIGNCNHNNLYYYPYGYEENIISCIESGNEKGLSDILNELIEKNISNPESDIHLKYFFYYDLLSTYKKAAELVQYNSQLIAQFMMKADKDYLSVKFCTEELCNAMLEICRFSKAVKQSKIDETAVRVERYISDNFANVNLNLNTIADHFEISRQTISKKFSEAFGMKVGDYIMEVRINAGKEFLSKLNLNISDIAILIGYTDSNSFIRAFKKYCGITPGQYRKNITDAEEE